MIVFLCFVDPSQPTIQEGSGNQTACYVDEAVLQARHFLFQLLSVSGCGGY